MKISDLDGMKRQLDRCRENARRIQSESVVLDRLMEQTNSSMTDPTGDKKLAFTVDVQRLLQLIESAENEVRSKHCANSVLILSSSARSTLHPSPRTRSLVSRLHSNGHSSRPSRQSAHPSIPFCSSVRRHSSPHRTADGRDQGNHHTLLVASHPRSSHSPLSMSIATEHLCRLFFPCFGMNPTFSALTGHGNERRRGRIALRDRDLDSQTRAASGRDACRCSSRQVPSPLTQSDRSRTRASREGSAATRGLSLFALAVQRRTIVRLLDGLQATRRANRSPTRTFTSVY